MPKRVSRIGGFTVLEAAVSLTVLAVALLTLWATLIYCSRSNLAAEQRKRALNAAQAKLEELKTRPFATLISEYGPDGSIGDRFPVPTIDDSESGASGRITFVVDEGGGSGSADAARMALPLDLNGDGDTDDEDVSGSYQLLPVRVTVRWTGVLGEQQVDLSAILRGDE